VSLQPLPHAPCDPLLLCLGTCVTAAARPVPRTLRDPPTLDMSLSTTTDLLSESERAVRGSAPSLSHHHSHHHHSPPPLTTPAHHHPPSTTTILQWLSIPSGFLVVFEKPNRSSFTCTITSSPLGSSLSQHYCLPSPAHSVHGLHAASALELRPMMRTPPPPPWHHHSLIPGPYH
jgi:hypothetical protein